MPNRENPKEIVLDTILVDKTFAANKRSQFIEQLLHSTVVKILGTTFLLSALFSISFLLAYQQIKKKETQDSLKEVPKAEVAIPNIVAYVNQQNDWKTYTNTTYNFSLQIPSLYEVTENPEETYTYIGEQISFYVYDKDVASCLGDCPVIYNVETIASNYELSKITGYIGEIGGNIPEEYISYQYKKDDFYYVFTLHALGKSERPTNSSELHKLKSEDIQLFESIMKSFTLGTDIPQEKFCGGIAGITCPPAYQCKLDGTYPDAGGICIILE